MLFKFQSAIKKLWQELSFLEPGFNSLSLKRINSNERNVIRKKERNLKGVLNPRFGETKLGINNKKFHNHNTKCTYLCSEQISTN